MFIRKKGRLRPFARQRVKDEQTSDQDDAAHRPVTDDSIKAKVGCFVESERGRSSSSLVVDKMRSRQQLKRTHASVLHS